MKHLTRIFFWLFLGLCALPLAALLILGPAEAASNQVLASAPSLTNRDGSFYGGRLRGLREQSYYYYTRLESDPALVLSQELWWARLASLPEPAAEPLPASSWHDSFHGAYLL